MSASRARFHCARLPPSWRPWPALACGLLLLAASACGDDEPRPPSEPVECLETTPSDLYTQRIAPLFAQDRPKSCNQCHLAGIDLGSFVRATPCETMACLTEQGLVDLDAPRDSLILSWIARAKPDSELITEAVIQEEYDGFLSWIEYSASCAQASCAGATCGVPSADALCKNEAEGGLYDAQLDPGDCSERTIEQLFRDTVYASRGRCFPCHFTGEKTAAPTAPRWISQDGGCDGASLATLRNVLASGYVNLQAPLESLLVLKPLAENGGVPHGGGAKFAHGDDTAFRNFSYWLERYAACQGM